MVFIARHGSWTRRPPVGYDVVFVRFDERGNPVGHPEPLLTGFLADTSHTHGRPTWVSFAQDGALLVSDDTAGIIWRVIAPAAAPAATPKAVVEAPLPAQHELHGDPETQFRLTFKGEAKVRAN